MVPYPVLGSLVLLNFCSYSFRFEFFVDMNLLLNFSLYFFLTWSQLGCL